VSTVSSSCNADDFNLTKDVTRRYREGHATAIIHQRHGYGESSRPRTGRDLARDRPRLGLGLHVTLRLAPCCPPPSGIAGHAGGTLRPRQRRVVTSPCRGSDPRPPPRRSGFPMFLGRAHAHRYALFSARLPRVLQSRVWTSPPTSTSGPRRDARDGLADPGRGCRPRIGCRDVGAEA